MKFAFLFLYLFASVVGLAQVTIVDPLSEPLSIPRTWSPDNIVWDTVFADGSRLAILEGRRDVPGMHFSYAFYLPDGQWVLPHWHCADARVFVVSGRLVLGYGDKMDKQKTQKFDPGSYLLVPYKVSHFEGAEGNTIIIGTGEGPWCTFEYPLTDLSEK